MTVLRYAEPLKQSAHWVWGHWLPEDWLRWLLVSLGRLLPLIPFDQDEWNGQLLAVRSIAMPMERVATGHNPAANDHLHQLQSQLLVRRVEWLVAVLHRPVHARCDGGCREGWSSADDLCHCEINRDQLAFI